MLSACSILTKISSLIRLGFLVVLSGKSLRIGYAMLNGLFGKALSPRRESKPRLAEFGIPPERLVASESLQYLEKD